MISILIPIFNYDVRHLVTSLHEQGLKCHIPFELILMDDASEEYFNQVNSPLGELSFCQYERLEKNLGRNLIRIRLAKAARFDNLLIIDCDGELLSTNFLNKYLKFCPFDGVVVGGRIYSRKPPHERNKYLRWKYG
ncbi:MAG: glycosyltransferase family 2 protein, partial [Chitinophagaceae bacterium]